eukprot:6214801-Pleurochrysis_carterae.AAC.1
MSMCPQLEVVETAPVSWIVLSIVAEGEAEVPVLEVLVHLPSVPVGVSVGRHAPRCAVGPRRAAASLLRATLRG